MLFYFEKLIYNNIGDNMKKIIIILLCIFILCSCDKKEKNLSSSCNEIENINYKIIFHSNGGNEIDTIEICDECERPADNSLPTLYRKNYIFGGWYYDSIFLMKADVKTIDELRIETEKDDLGCDYKYKDINLYALWIEK